MADLQDILKEASRRNITLWVEDGQLRYRAPANALSPEFRAALIGHKVSLIESWPWNAIGSDNEGEPGARHTCVPVPAYMHGLWRSVLRGELDVSYTNIIHNVLRCKQRLDLGLLGDAVVRLIERHPILAARVENAINGPVLVLDGREVDLQCHDLSHLGVQAREEAVTSLAYELVWRPFQPEQGPLMSAFAIQLGEEDFVIGFVLHHLVSDLVSVRIFAFEWLQTYECLLRGHQILLAPPSMTYEDYLQNMDAWIAADGARDLVEYWRESQRNAPRTLLPPNPTPESVTTNQIISYPIRIDEKTTRSARLFAATHGVTLFQVLLGAMGCALAESTGQSDISIMFTTICRDDPKLMGTIGSLLNIVHLRLNVEPEEPIDALMKKVRVAYAGAIKHQLCPYELVRQVRSEVGGCAELPYAPHFNFVDVAPAARRNATQEEAAASVITPLDLGPNPAAAVRETEFCSFYSPFTAHEHGINGSIQYSPILCEEHVVERYVASFCAAVARIATETA